MTTDTPHSKHEHLFVVLRIDDFESAGLAEDNLSAVSVFRTRHDAEREAERLGALRPGSRSRYVVLTSRLKESTESDG